jgi:molybdopterin molybdotransferase
VTREMLGSETLISLEDARTLILEQTPPLVVEDVDIVSSLGRVLACDLASDIDIAPFDNTSMDGFALKSSDLTDASETAPVALDVVAHIGAGFVYDDELASGQAVRIMTGAPIPEGADAVVKVEDATWTGAGGVGEQVMFKAPITHGASIRLHGEECLAGDTVMQEGEVITTSGAGLLASTGHLSVPVYRCPRVGIISLGSELVDADVVPGPGQIRNSNSYSLAAEVVAAGASPVIYPTVADDPASIAQALTHACAVCNVVVSSGGASGGDFDFITQAADSLGQVFFKYVNMKPGKSQTFAVIGKTPFFGLAGNPAAAAVGFEMLVRPLLRKMLGHATFDRPITRAVLSGSLKKVEQRRSLLRGRVERQSDGSYVAKLAKNQSSALLGALHHANCLIVIPEGGVQVVDGMMVDCIRLDMLEGTA